MTVAAWLANAIWVLSATAAALGHRGADGAQDFADHARMPVTVVLVKDGDTVQVREFRNDIRLASIDAPETAHARGRPGQQFSQASRKTLIELLGSGKHVEAYCYERDRYERHVCDLYANNVSVNRALVATGMAWANQAAGGRYLRDRQLLVLQEQARSRGDGLWASKAPIEPWVWRDMCWKDGRCAE